MTNEERWVILVWKAWRGTLERDRLVALGEDWPPNRCVRARVVPSDDDRHRASVVIAGPDASVAFALSIENVAPFPIELRAYSRVKVNVEELRAKGAAPDACEWEVPDKITGYQRIAPGEAYPIPFKMPTKRRVFSKPELTAEACQLLVTGDLAVLGPWAAHEQRVQFSSSIWLPTRLDSVA